MSKMNLLLVEDNKQDQDNCLHAVEDLQADHDITIDLTICRNVEDALNALRTKVFDGAIIDMRLANDGNGNEGNDVIAEIKHSFHRIPVAILTGTPDPAESEGFPSIGIYRKGEEDSTYEILISKFHDIYTTGLTKILGGRGEIEKSLGEIFTKNLLNHTDKWVEYGKKDPERTEKSLLRYTVNHLMQLLDEGVEKYYPEEFYLCPPLSPRLFTGSVLQNKNSRKWFVIINPACDLALREDGGCKTDRALLVEVDNLIDLFPELEGWTQPYSRSNQSKIDKANNNTNSLYYHCLPKTSFYIGGYLNFRKLSTHDEEDLLANFYIPHAQISAAFIKDIVSRFSSYYARQGQPEIDF